MGQQLQDSTIPDGFPGQQNNEKERTKSNSVISTDFETAINKAGFGKFNYFMLLIAIPASCTSAFCTGTMSFVVPVAGPDLGLTQTKKALLQSAPYAGMICSAFFWGVLSDSFGRKRLIVAGFLLDSVMNTCCALIPYLPSILLFKFLAGFMVCGPYSIFMTYVSEVFNSQKRELVVLSSGVFGAILQIGHVVMAMTLIPWEPPSWLPLKSWQLFILACGVPSFICGSACAFCTESPKFLMDKGKSEKALKVCKTIYTINTGQSADSYPVKKIHSNTIPENGKKVSALKKILAAADVLKPPYISRLSMIFGMQAFIVTTLNLIRLWLPEMLTVMANVDPQTTNSSTVCPALVAGREAQASTNKIVTREYIYIYMIILNVCCFAGQVTAITFLKGLKKKLIIISAASISLCAAASIPNVPGEYVFIPASMVVAILNITFFTQINLIVEIFPTSVRATSMSLNMMVGRIGVLIGNFVFANLIYSYCEYIFYGMGAFCLGIICICSFLDTTPFIDRSLQKIDEEI